MGRDLWEWSAQCEDELMLVFVKYLKRLVVCPTCGDIFEKRTRGRFCSTCCQMKTYMRSYRKRRKV